MTGSAPMGPMPLHPEDMGHSYPERPTEETIRIDNWAVGAHCDSISLLLLWLRRFVWSISVTTEKFDIIAIARFVV